MYSFDETHYLSLKQGEKTKDTEPSPVFGPLSLHIPGIDGNRFGIFRCEW